MPFVFATHLPCVDVPCTTNSNCLCRLQDALVTTPTAVCAFYFHHACSSSVPATVASVIWQLSIKCPALNEIAGEQSMLFLVFCSHSQKLRDSAGKVQLSFSKSITQSTCNCTYGWRLLIALLFCCSVYLRLCHFPCATSCRLSRSDVRFGSVLPLQAPRFCRWYSKLPWTRCLWGG